MKITHRDIILYYNRSLAFLEHARITSSSVDSELYNTEEYFNITAYSLYHSLELFIKFAILARTSQEELVTSNKYKTHNLKNLIQEYKDLYPEEIYDLQLPFDDEVFKGLDNLDQMLKYPTDNKNELWKRSLIFSYTKDFIEQLQTNIQSIGSKIMLELNEKIANYKDGSI